jgi:hypothetical protein
LARKPQAPDFDVDMVDDSTGTIIDLDDEVQVQRDLNIMDVESIVPTDIPQPESFNIDMRRKDKRLDIDRVPTRKEVDVNIETTIPTNVAPLKPFDMDMRRQEQEISFNDVSSMPDLTVDPSTAPMDADASLFESLGDVEMEQFKETEFEGVGDIDFDEEEEDEEDLDINMRQDMRL